MTVQRAPVKPQNRRFLVMDGFAGVFLVALYFAFPISVAAANISMVCVLAGWLLAGGFRYRWSVVAENPMTYPALALCGLLLVAVTYTKGGLSDVFFALGKYSKLMYFIVFLSLIDSPSRREKCLNAFIAALLITLLSTYASIWVELPWSKTRNLGWGVDHTVFKDYISQGEQMSLFILLAIAKAWNSTSKHARVAWLALGLLAAVSITHLSSGRTGQVALVFSLFAAAVIAAPRHYRIVSVVSVAMITVALVMSSNSLQRGVEKGIGEARNRDQASLTSIGQRLDFLEKSVQLMRERPLFGWGTGAYPSQYCRIASSPEWCEAGKFHPHNQFIFFGVELGLVGMIVFAWFMLRPLWFARSLQIADRLPISGFIGIFLVGSLTHSSLYLSTENHFFIFMMAALMAVACKPVASVAHQTPDKALVIAGE